MPTIDIEGELVDFPDDLPPDQLEQAVASAAQQMGKVKSPGLMRKGWDALAVPERMSREGLKMISDAIPEQPIQSESAALNFIGGVPRVAAETLGEAAPGFVSRASLLMGGAAKAGQKAAPAVKAMMRSIGKQGESVSGAVPGALEAAYKDASLMGSKGKQAVSKMYEASKAKSGPIRPELAKISDKRQAVDEALKFADDGTLTPLEALEARKELVKIKKSVPNTYFRYATDKLNAVAKTVFGVDDAAYQRANMAESLRNVVPQNKYGGASAFKMMLMKLASDEGMGGKLISLAMSPAVQGAAATGAGVAARNVISPLAANPRVASAAANALPESIRLLTEALSRRKANAR